MFYKNNKTKEVVELIYSDNLYCIYVPLEEIVNIEGELNGTIFYGNKDKFKKEWSKAKKIDCLPLEEEAVKSIISTFLFDKRKFFHDDKLDDLVVLTQHLYEGKPKDV